MKKISIGTFATLGLICLLSISGCKKVWDQIKQHPGGAADNCNVKQIAFTGLDFGGEFFPDTATFKYNSYGDPIEVHFRSSQFVYRYDKVFKYDNQRRLLVYRNNAITEPGFTYADFWHKYTYINATKIIDSIFLYASGDLNLSDRPGEFNSTRVSILTLDSWGRVVNDGATTYSYDAQGNLVKPGTTYTNKTNIRQTNKVWMFIDRDYSINQPEGEAVQFNTNKLPVKFGESNYDIFEFHGFFRGVVTYKCD